MASAVLTVCFLAGLALLSYGAWLAWHPAGFMVAGLFLVAVPLIWTRGKRAPAQTVAQ